MKAAVFMRGEQAAITKAFTAFIGEVFPDERPPFFATEEWMRPRDRNLVFLFGDCTRRLTSSDSPMEQPLQM